MALIPQEKIEEIRTSSDIVSYIARYVSLKKTGKNFKGLCPFHKEKTPSFIISPDKQIYHCFGCGKGGNIFGFLMEIENISYIEAIRKIAFDLGISLPKARTERHGQDTSEYDLLFLANQTARDFFVNQMAKITRSSALEYLKRRQLKPETIEKFQIGFAPKQWDAIIQEAKRKNINQDTLIELGLIQKKEGGTEFFDKFRNRIMFPFHNTSGRIVGFGGRRLQESDQPKYLNSPESRIYKKGEILYGLHQALAAIRDQKYAIIVEGYFDLLRLVDVGINNVVASSGTALTEGQGRLLKRYTNTIIISYDSDDAGVKAAIRNGQILESLDLAVYLVEMPKPHDPDSYVLKEGKTAYLKLIQKKISPVEFLLKDFKTHHPSASIEEKNQFIDTIFESLILLPNDVKIGLYLHELSEKLELAESFLISRFNRLKKQRRFQKSYSHETEDSEQIKSGYKKGEWRAEEGILSLLLLDNAQINKQILQNVSASDFENEDIKEIFEYISHQWEEVGTINISKINKEFSSKTKAALLSKLFIQDIHDENKFAADCIYKIRKRSLDIRFNDIKKLMNEEASSDDSVLHYMKELTEIRSKLSEIEKEHARHFKLDL
jgi:DNA primase